MDRIANPDCLVRLEDPAILNSNFPEEKPHFCGRRDPGFVQDLNRMLQLMPERHNEFVFQLRLLNPHSEYSTGASKVE